MVAMRGCVALVVGDGELVCVVMVAALGKMLGGGRRRGWVDEPFLPSAMAEAREDGLQGQRRVGRGKKTRQRRESGREEGEG